MNNINYIKVITGLVMIDTSLTFYCVSYMGAIELNPLGHNFDAFITWKIVLSLLCLATIFYLRKEQIIKPFLMFLVGFYGIVTVTNIVELCKWWLM